MQKEMSGQVRLGRGLGLVDQVHISRVTVCRPRACEYANGGNARCHRYGSNAVIDFLSGGIGRDTVRIVTAKAACVQAAENNT